MSESTDELAELEKEIRRIIKDNEKFLTRMLDEDFSDDEDDTAEDSVADEEL
jgi:cell pole-organizing protein PopZ